MNELEEKNRQTEANKKWQQQNKDYSNYLKARSTARGFIKNKATLEDLAEILKLVAERRQELEK